MANRRGASRRPSALRRLARIASGLVGLAALAAVAALLVGTVGIFAPIRTAAVEQMLSAALGASVDIEGGVEIDYGSTVSISGSRIRIARPAGAPAGEVDMIEAGTVGLGFHQIIAGRFDLHELTLAGVSLAENSTLVGLGPDAAEGDTAEDDATRLHWFGIVPVMVRLATHADIAISDVHYLYRNPVSGWDFNIAVSSIATDRSGANGTTTIAVAGTVNGSAVKIDGEIQPLAKGGTAIGDGFTLRVTAPGAKIAMRSIVPSDPGALLREVAVTADLISIGDTLDLFRIARAIEGTAKLTAGIDTSAGVSAMRNLKADVMLDAGPSFRIDGSIDNLKARQGFDLAVDATWPPDTGGPLDENGLLTFKFQDVSARLTGDLGALAMTDGWVTTNLFSNALPRLGPITAGAIRRDEQGRISVTDIHVLAGPADQPTLDLTGEIGGLLQLSDFRLSGNVSIPTGEAIGIDTKDETALGRLTGTFAVSDASGAAGVDTFSAKLTGTSLASADVTLTASQAEPQETATFALSLDIPDYAPLATAIGLKVLPAGAIRYKGALSLTPDEGSIDGKLSFGKTDLTGTLTIKAEGTRPLVAGKISTPSLRLADARHIAEVGLAIRELRADSEAKREKVEVPPHHTSPQPVVIRPKFDIEVSAGKIEGTSSAVSGVSGRVLVDEKIVTAKSFALTFKGGKFSFDGQMNVGEASRPFSAKGRIADWPLGDVLKELELDLPITGVLDTSFDVASSGTSVDAAMRAAKGDLYARIVNGVIGNRLIDLTGLVLPSWLFSASAKSGSSRVECFSAKLEFVPGLATLQAATVETDEVMVNATGRIDFKNDTIDIEAQPRALSPNLIPIVSPFAIRGSFSDPKVVVKGGVAGRAVAETLALPLNTLGTLLGVDKTGPKPKEIEKNCR